MVDIEEVQKAAYRITKVGTSGYDSTPEFLGKANEVNLDLMNLFTPHYGKIQAVSDILNPFVVSSTPTIAAGKIELPNKYYGFIGAFVTATLKPLRKLNPNQISTNQQNSIRKRTNDNPGYSFLDGKIQLTPLTAASGTTMVYFRMPNDVAMTVVPTANEDDDYLTVSAKTNYEWPERVKNLIIYLLVQRLGVEMKEPILYELSQLGITQNLTTKSAD
jgi:hypothetical protein